MSVMVEKKFEVEIAYNGLTKSFQVETEERVTALLQRAIATFGITQQPHLLSLYGQDGSVISENESVGAAGIKPHEALLLRQNVVKGGRGVLRLAAGIVAQSIRTLRDCGRGECECVVYWTGPSEDDLVDGVEHPIHERSPFGYQVDDDWLTHLSKQLATSKRSVKSQLHTHPGRAFHSATDDNWPIVSLAGFMSIVIPNFAIGEDVLERAWIGCLQPDGTWRHVSSTTEIMVPA